MAFARSMTRLADPRLAAVAAGALLLGAVAPVSADLLTYFNFNNSAPGSGGGPGVADFTPGGGVYATQSTFTPGNLAGTNGGTTANNNYGTFGGTTVNAVGTDVAGQAFAPIGSGNNGNYFQLTTPTTGYQAPVISFAAQRTSTGFNNNTLSYSTDGTNFTDFATFSPNLSTAGGFTTQTFDLSGVTTLANQPSVTFRITLGGATSTSGNNRYDNIQVNASPLTSTSPATVTLGAAPGAGANFGTLVLQGSNGSYDPAVRPVGASSGNVLISGTFPTPSTDQLLVGFDFAPGSALPTSVATTPSGGTFLTSGPVFTAANAALGGGFDAFVTITPPPGANPGSLALSFDFGGTVVDRIGAVPEPTLVGLLAPAGLLLARRRRA